MTDLSVLRDDGLSFEDGADRIRIIVSSDESGGEYSLLEWTVAAGAKLPDGACRDYAMHLHGACEETFLILSGELEFVIGNRIVRLGAGDFARVPPNTPHGYQNVSGESVEMLVGFHPGGFEKLFVKYRSDQSRSPSPGFIEEATSDYASSFGLPNP